MTKITDPFITKLYKTYKTKLQYSKKYMSLIIAFIYFLLIKMHNGIKLLNQWR